MSLTEKETLRYKRQISVPQIGIKGQQKLKNASALVIGAGGLGCPILLYLAGAGVGKLACIDFDQVELHNLHRQIAHTEESVDTPKVTSLKLQIEKLNADISFTPIFDSIHSKNAEQYISQYDLVIDGSDNFKSRYLVNDICVKLNKPLVYGSIFNFEVQLAVFNYRGSKNLRNIFPDPPEPEDIPNCSLHGVMASTPGILGTLMAHEALKIITGLPTLHNEWLVVDTLNVSSKKISF
ncbi:HesA/MoeB/ThiF family protein [Sphingobacterium sp. UT-1RO-CII-1]|uniref:HesA/MoeB/ThiF family protein n=1 Tax=Sphingobacterium sp. UT-1RO-CII-1 TaxID=2995225 RepID=UPI00227A8E2A|nr:HesA/MoeB/ThiF family protein [Sphingobacterium sp. UT-1RO-CII-1]MCY4781397.1 HesA/MoeB/ThiF family protein [Sphingobacterium sp. UT-1RO-CII-1]